MAFRARLVAPPSPSSTVWRWHTAKHSAISVSAFAAGDRRMEADTYLSSGFGIKLAIEGKRTGWRRFGELATVWMPGRLKGIQVERNVGTPFLAATQVFDVRPVPRKWFALARTSEAERRFIKPGTIVVTRSGSVGRATVAYAVHEKTLISDDLLRVEATDEKSRGWIYAFLRAPQTRAMAVGAQYGHMIKHLETGHLDALPIPVIDDAAAADFNDRVARILNLRNDGYRLELEAEATFENALGAVKIVDWGETGFSVKASAALLRGRRRFDASVHSPAVAAIWHHLAKNGEGFTAVGEAGFDVWLPSRFRRVPADDGVPLVESSALVEINPDIDKRISEVDFGDPYKGRVESGWVLVARSGQIYGINGSAVLSSEAIAGYVVSDDVLRVAPKSTCRVRPGYLLVTLAHPVLGRPLVKSLAYGSSIPHIDPGDFVEHQIVRLKPSVESAIADLAEASAAAKARADVLERALATDADAIITRFIAGKPLRAVAASQG